MLFDVFFDQADYVLTKTTILANLVWSKQLWKFGFVVSVLVIGSDEQENLLQFPYHSCRLVIFSWLFLIRFPGSWLFIIFSVTFWNPFTTNIPSESFFLEIIFQLWRCHVTKVIVNKSCEDYFYWRSGNLWRKLWCPCKNTPKNPTILVTDFSN